MATFAQTIGLTTEQFSSLSLAAQKTGASTEAVQTMLTRIAQTLEDARTNASGRYAKMFAEFGIDTRQDIAGVVDQLLKLNDVGKVAQIVGARGANVLGRIGTRFGDLNSVMQKNVSLNFQLNQIVIFAKVVG